jgi:phosphoribosyl 1,2-cyclic phosphodiesterase
MQPGSKDRRRNTCLLVQLPHPDDAALTGQRVRSIMIDAGKFFYQSAIEMFPRFKVWSLDAVVLTHAHADAAGGLDDLRDWTNNNRQASIPIYYRPEDFEILSRTHYYLFDRANADTAGSVAKLQFHEVGRAPLEVEGLQLTPLPVWHGRPYSANGYRFGSVCYLPDVSEIPEETRPLMAGCDLLIIDALRPRRTHGSHLTIEQALDEVRRHRPRRALLTGMCHELVHEQMNEALARLKASESLDVQLAYDGLAVDVEL